MKYLKIDGVDYIVDGVIVGDIGLARDLIASEAKKVKREHLRLVPAGGTDALDK